MKSKKSSLSKTDRSSSWADGIAWLFLLGLWAWFHERVIFQGHAFVMEDASRFFYPFWLHGQKVFEKGLIPLWNPDAGFGTPCLADPEMVCWYPPVRFFYLLFSPVTAFDLSILSHHLFALVGFWFFAKGRGFSSYASAAGALLFGFATSAVCYTWDPAMLFSYSWIPWVFWASDRYGKGTRGSFLMLSVCLGMQMASGYPLYSYLTLLALTLEGVIRAVWEGSFSKNNRVPWAKRFALYAAAILTAVGFNLAWGLPLMELRGLSNLSARLGMAQSLPLESLGTWLNPFFYGQPLYSTGAVPYWLCSSFMGLPLLGLLVWALLRRKMNWASLFLFLLWVLLSLGDTTKIGGWMRSYFPLYGWVVRSGYLLPLVFFFGARLGMESSAHWVSSDAGRKSFGAGRLLILLPVFALPYYLGTPLDLWPTWASLLCLAASSIGFLWGRWPAARWVLLLLSIVFSLGPADQGVNFTLEKAFYEEKPPILESLSGPGRVYQSPQEVDSFQTVSGANLRDIFQQMKQNLVPNGPLAYGLEEVSYPNPIMTASFLRWYLLSGELSPKASDHLLDYLGVQYRIGGAASASYRPLAVPGNSVPLFENKNPSPKWFSVSRALPEGDWRTDWTEKNIVGFNFKEECRVSNPALFGSYEPRTVAQVLRTANEIELTAVGKGKALLVSSETAYPGWRIIVDGKERPAEEVNGGFRGAVLTPGEEEVRIAYRPVTFRLGCFLSLLVMGLWAGLCGGLRTRN